MIGPGHSRWEWGIAVLACAAAAVLIVLGDFLADVDADDLLPALVSLQAWTPFFWEQDRLGMLVPLLAMPVRSPLLNLVFQNGLQCFAGLLAFVLGARVLSHRPGAVLAGLATALLFLATSSRDLLHAYLASSQPYAPSLALAFGGLLCLERIPVARAHLARLLLGFALLALALYVNVALLVLLAAFTCVRAVPVVISLARARTPLRAAWRDPALFSIALVLVAGLGNLVVARIARYGGETIPDRLPPAEWTGAWIRFLENGARALPSSWLLAAAMGLVVWLVFVLVPSPRAISREEVVSTAAALMAATVTWLFNGALLWVALNGHELRYAVPPLVVLFGALVSFGFTRVPLTPRVRLAALGLCAALLLTAAVERYGRPSLASVRARLDVFGYLTGPLRATHATHLAGNYWAVWPVVFHQAMVRHERGLEEELFGVAHRYRPTAPLWEKAYPRERFRVAAILGDDQALEWMRDAGLGDFVPVEEAAPLRIFIAP